MTGFFTAEASEDCLSMIESLIAITNRYCNLNNNTGELFFFLPRRISQDLIENAFSRIRVAIGHGRLDHITTFNACTEVNMIKEVKISERSLKRRNAAGAQIEILYSNKDCLSYDDSIEYASNCRKNGFKNRIQMYGNSKKTHLESCEWCQDDRKHYVEIRVIAITIKITNTHKQQQK